MQLQYQEAYALHCELTPHSGRGITLEKLHQPMTYIGLEIGVPTPEYNDRIIQRAVEESVPYPRPDGGVVPG